MRRGLLLVAVALWAMPQLAEAACTKCVAKQIVTTQDASKYLFGGTDAAGGINDWYLTNKKVEAIIDDIGTVDVPLAVGGTTPVNKTSSNAVATGGTLVDVGLYKQNNDQLPQSFTVGGLSLANVMLFRQGDETVWGVPSGNNPCPSIDGSGPAACASDANCGSITVFGIMLMPNVSTQSNPTLNVRTRYEMCDGEQQIRMRTEVWNNSSGTVTPLPIIDVFLWGGRGLVPFVAADGRGFNHTNLDLSQAASLLVTSPYWFAPGNVNKTDGKIARGKQAKPISYGYFTGTAGQPCALNDADGPGPTAPTNIVGLQPHALTGLHGSLLSAGILPLVSGNGVPVGASRIFNRTLVVGKANDGNSVTGDPKNAQNIFTQIGYATGVQPGSVSPGSPDEGTITFIRTGGAALNPPIANNSPVTSIRAKGGFKVVLPLGTYMAHAVFPGRDDIFSGPYTINSGNNPAITIDASSQPKVGKVTATIVDATTMTGIPAKVSLSPSPIFRRDFEAMSYDARPGMCSNDLTQSCSADSDCGGSNTCFRTCSNNQPATCTTNANCSGTEVCASDGRCRSHACSVEADCNSGNVAGYVCIADTSSIAPEGYPGGAAQLNVIYTADGKVNQTIKPGTYTATISRGLEYTARQFPVTVTANGTIDIGGGSPITLSRVVDTTGWLSADFHIHSARSLDSSAPLEGRVRSFAGEGLEVMVSTDHDIVTDYNPAIAKLKLGSFIGSIVGTEVTTSVGTPPYFSNSWGHINSWPQHFDPNLRRSGSVEDENVSANVIYNRLRSAMGPTHMQCIGGKNGGNLCAGASDCPGGTCTDVGEPVVQLNHPRAGVSGIVSIGMFDNIGFDPSATINDCQKYPVICPTSQCFNGTNDGTSCTSNATCTGGGVCGCASGSVPAMANGCNKILLDLNVVPQSTLCTTPGCGGLEGANDTRNIDFDMMEIDNGGRAGSFTGTLAVRHDWISLLNQNVLVGKTGSHHTLWGTGVSDSHRLVAELPGYSRTFVQAGDLPSPSIGLNVKNFNQKVLGGKMFATTGPVLTVTADTGGPAVGLGDSIDASGGSVNLNIEVQAAPWIPIDEVRVIKNGCVMACYNTTTTPAVSAQPSPFDQTNSGVVRFNATIPDTVTEDSYYIVEASQDIPLSGTPDVDPVVDSIASGAFPFGFTNPIFAIKDGTHYGSEGLPGIGTPDASCGPLPPSCSAGSAIAMTQPETMFAKATPKTIVAWFDAFLSALVPNAAAHADDPPRPRDEAERLRQHEANWRKGSLESFPRNLFVIPTPKPEAEEQPVQEQPPKK